MRQNNPRVWNRGTGKEICWKNQGGKSCEIVLIIVMVQSLVRGLDEDVTLKSADRTCQQVTDLSARILQLPRGGGEVSYICYTVFLMLFGKTRQWSYFAGESLSKSLLTSARSESGKDADFTWANFQIIFTLNWIVIHFKVIRTLITCRGIKNIY
jgi:hypothetical protein